MNFYCHHYLSDDLNKKYLQGLKICIVSPSAQQPIIKLVDRMLELNKKLREFGDQQSTERQQLEREIVRTDREIDALVYALYGISEEEQKTIEESLAGK